jgi:precorrin-6A/cobalt-precorrin-6A reductase
MILVMAGTSDARELAVKISQAGYELLTTVVTDSGARSMEEAGLPVLTGRLTAEAIAQLVKERGIRTIVDATHPFAEEASNNAIAAAQAAEVPYIRFERDRLTFEGNPLITYADDYEQAAQLAAERKGVILLTTGSKTLHIFAKRLLGLQSTTLVARMLPRKDNMEKCEELGLEQKNIIAMQGPFSKELNKALYEHYRVTLMITKESGKVGAVDEKLESALEMGIETIVIGRPEVEYGLHYGDFDSVIAKLNELLKEA